MLKRLSKLLAGGADERPPATRVAVFGKHPGWNDHMQELGLDTAALVDVRRVLYTEGVGRNVDSGAWDGLAEADRLVGFGHVFLRQTEATIVGRLWSSTDGRGRDRYPMVLAVQCAGMDAAAALRALAGPMREARDALAAAETADAVRTLHAGLTAETTRALAMAHRSEHAAIAALRDLADHDDLGPHAEGLLRVLYEYEREVGAADARGGSSAGRRPATGRLEEPRGHLIRVPRGDGDPESAIARWYDLLVSWGARGPGLLLAARDDAPWVDIVVGTANAGRLACLRTGTGRIPLSSSIPFTMDDAFRSRVTERIRQARAEGPR